MLFKKFTLVSVILTFLVFLAFLLVLDIGDQQILIQDSGFDFERSLLIPAWAKSIALAVFAYGFARWIDTCLDSDRDVERLGSTFVGLALGLLVGSYTHVLPSKEVFMLLTACIISFLFGLAASEVLWKQARYNADKGKKKHGPIYRIGLLAIVLYASAIGFTLTQGVVPVLVACLIMVMIFLTYKAKSYRKAQRKKMREARRMAKAETA